jgi:hypothetical protein
VKARACVEPENHCEMDEQRLPTAVDASICRRATVSALLRMGLTPSEQAERPLPRRRTGISEVPRCGWLLQASSGRRGCRFDGRAGVSQAAGAQMPRSGRLMSQLGGNQRRSGTVGAGRKLKSEVAGNRRPRGLDQSRTRRCARRRCPPARTRPGGDAGCSWNVSRRADARSRDMSGWHARFIGNQPRRFSRRRRSA